MAHEQAADLPHNQRLEFLGDAVLGMILTAELYEKFPLFGEGPLTKARAELVNRRSLAEQARRLGMGECLTMSRGEAASGGRHRQSALADAFEAVVGALFLDGGLEVARTFLRSCFQDYWGELTVLPRLDNPKGELQELLQARSPVAPRYQTTSVSGPDHDRSFECAVHHRGVELGRGRGKSKKAAESMAAQAALQRLKEENSTPALASASTGNDVPPSDTMPQAPPPSDSSPTIDPPAAPIHAS